MVTGPTALQGSHPIPGAPMVPTNLPAHAPPMLPQSMGNLHPGSDFDPHGLVAHQYHTLPGLCHQPCEPPSTHSSAPPTPAGGIVAVWFLCGLEVVVSLLFCYRI